MKYIKIQDLIDELLKSGKAVFTIHEAALLTGKREAYLSRLLPTNKKINRIERGKYYIGTADAYEIAANIIYPSYISLMSAFRYYDITTQEPVVIGVIALKSHKSIKVGEVSISFTKFKKKRFFGYKKYGNIFMATIEKAIVDSLYLNNPEISAVEEAISRAIENKSLDVASLKRFALDMDSRPVINKLGFLLESKDIMCDDLLSRISKRYIVLVKNGNKNKKWHVIV
jgi:predicted transcriptional regulator of viral defense system